MKKQPIKIPGIFQINDHSVPLLVATHLFQQGKISVKEAAAAAGLSENKFKETLGIPGTANLNNDDNDNLATENK